MRFSTERILKFNDLKREYVRWVYQVTGKNKTETARLLGMDRSSLYRLLRRYDLAENDTEEITQRSIDVPLLSDPPLASTDDPRIREVCDVTHPPEEEEP